jgi:predicted metal-dependent phosphotriesterase family hydrolase
MTFVRTVLGDIDPADLGVTYAHEHLVIGPCHTVDLQPDFLLVDVDKAVAELAPVQALGLRSVVDAMPIGAGRDVRLLAEVSRRSGVQLVAPTGLHHARHYPPRHWSESATSGELADLFIADISDGIDALDYNGPVIRRTPHRAGVIKIGASEGGPSERDARVFEAAAIAHVRTGCPIITHCENGTGALEQVAMLGRFGVPAPHIVLSHVDKVADRGYQREILASGAYAEYDQSFRWKDARNGTLDALRWAAEDGTIDRVLLGMDAARQGYWTSYGGWPGMTWLLSSFSSQMHERGLGDAELHQVFVTGPARAYAFGSAAATD